MARKTIAKPAPRRPSLDRREIPQRELRNSVSRILADVARGKSFRITVSGKPVADLVPASTRRTWVPREVLERIIREAPLDKNFMRDVRFMREQRVDEQ